MMSSEYDLSWIEEALLTGTLLDKLGAVAFSNSKDAITTELSSNTNSHIPTVDAAPHVPANTRVSNTDKVDKATVKVAVHARWQDNHQTDVNVPEASLPPSKVQKVRTASITKLGQAATASVSVSEVSPSALAAAAMDAAVAAAEAGGLPNGLHDEDDEDDELQLACNANRNLATGAAADDTDWFSAPLSPIAVGGGKKWRRGKTAAILDTDSDDDDDYLVHHNSPPSALPIQQSAGQPRIPTRGALAAANPAAAPAAAAAAAAGSGSAAAAAAAGAGCVGVLVQLQGSDDEEECAQTAAAQQHMHNRPHHDAAQHEGNGRFKSRPSCKSQTTHPIRTDTCRNNACTTAAAPVATDAADTTPANDTCQECDGEGTVAVQCRLGVSSVAHVNQQCNACAGSGEVAVSPDNVHAPNASTSDQNHGEQSATWDMVHVLENGLDHTPEKKNTQEKSKGSVAKLDGKGKASRAAFVGNQSRKSDKGKEMGGAEDTATQSRRRCALCKYASFVLCQPQQIDL